MAFAMPTSDTYTLLSYDEGDDLYESVVGVSAGLISTVSGQDIARACERVYWRIHEALQPQGWTGDQIDHWLSGPGKSMHLYCAAARFLRDKIDLDASFWSVAKEYMEECDKIMHGKGVLLDDEGNVLTRDTSSAAASGRQADYTARNAQADDDHDFVYDWDRRQFSRNPQAERVANRRYPNQYREDI